MVQPHAKSDRDARTCALGIDLGGSRAKLGLVSGGGALLAEQSVPVPDGCSAEATLAPIAAAADGLLALAAGRGLVVAAVGCGISGYLDAATGAIDLNNTAALNGFPIGAWLAARFGLPAVVDNDACAAAFAEWSLAGGRCDRRLLFVTVGSGIGVVLVAEGALVRVMHGVTGDAAHVIVVPGSEHVCPLGCHGCLETVASARAIEREAAALPGLAASVGAPTAADVSAAAQAGDPAAHELLRRAGAWLGIGLASWLPIYEPDTILLGGGVSAAGPEWLVAADEAMRRHGCPFFTAKVTIGLAALGNRAGVLGAALLALGAPPAR
jgi:glucokinase